MPKEYNSPRELLKETTEALLFAADFFAIQTLDTIKNFDNVVLQQGLNEELVSDTLKSFATCAFHLYFLYEENSRLIAAMDKARFQTMQTAEIPQNMVN